MNAGETAPSAGPDPLTLARAEMVEGETLVWADTSSAKGARRRVLPLSLLGGLFLLLALAWLAKAAIASFWLLILGLPFLLGAAALALLPWWWPSFSRHTVYGISDRRLLIIQNWPRRRVTSYGPEEIDVIERRENRDGSGDLIFRQEEHGKLRHHQDRRTKRRMSERPVGFYGVPDVRRLEKAVFALKQKRYLAGPQIPNADPSAGSAGLPPEEAGRRALSAGDETPAPPTAETSEQRESS